MLELYIGLMSGTSLDGIDAGLVDFSDDKIRLLAFEYLSFSGSIKKEIQHLSQANSPVLLKDYGSIDSQLGHLFAQATKTLLKKANISSSNVIAIGSHGLTVYHAPQVTPAFSLQIGNPNIIAEETGITTISDFRRRDIAAGGQGAPLAPAFHHAIFSQILDLKIQNICIINIGGIANITYLSKDKTIGFDTGPGNTLMDYWTQKNLNKPYDKNGDWAKTGKPDSALVSLLKQDPYFKLPPPKSTGKEYLSSAWIQEKIKQFSNGSAKDIQASLCQLTADTISDAILQYAPQTNHTLICGGGMHNSYLVELIRENLTHPVESTAKYGINPDYIEAMAFAWLAKQTINNLPGNLTKVTGAKAPVILGGIYPGKQGGVWI